MLGLTVSAAKPGPYKAAATYENLDTELPVSIAIPDDGTGRQFLVLQGGKILILPKDRDAAGGTEPVFEYVQYFLFGKHRVKNGEIVNGTDPASSSIPIGRLKAADSPWLTVGMV